MMTAAEADFGEASCVVVGGAQGWCGVTGEWVGMVGVQHVTG